MGGQRACSISAAGAAPSLHTRRKPASSRGGGAAVGIDSVPSDAIAGTDFDLRGNIDAANLPFPDRSFSHVSSQFGIEYAAFKSAIAEAARVCSESIGIMSHAADSIVRRQSAEQVAQLGWLLDDLGFPQMLRTHFQAPTTATAHAITGALNAMHERARTAENTGILETAQAAAFALQDAASTQPAATPLPAIETFGSELALHRSRMHAMASAALSKEDIAHAKAALSAAGFSVSAETLRDESDETFAWWLTAKRL